jgi:hypothetical protein
MVFAVFVDAVVQHGISQVLLVVSHVFRDVPRMDVLALSIAARGDVSMFFSPATLTSIKFMH